MSSFPLRSMKHPQTTCMLKYTYLNGACKQSRQCFDSNTKCLSDFDCAFVASVNQ